MILFLLSNILVFLNAYLLTKIFHFKRIVDLSITFFLFYIAQIILAELIFGIIGKLYFTNILLILTIFLIINYIATRRIKQRSHISISSFSFIYESKILIFAISIFLGFFIPRLWKTFINPPLRSDALIYHLAFPATWIKNFNFHNPLVAFGAPGTLPLGISLSFWPFNGELLFLWLMFPFRSAFLANIAQAPFYLIGILAIYSILEKFSIQKHIALLIGLLWVLIPNCFKQISEGAYIDIMCAAVFFMLINYLLILKENFDKRSFLLFGICSGIYIGLKTLNIFWLLSLLPLFIYIILNKIKGKDKVNILGNFALVLGFFLLFSSYPFIRNFLLTKNIFYPVRVEIFGKTIMPGIISRLEFANITYRFSEFSLRKLFFSEGLGAQLFTFILPGTFIPLFTSVFIQKRKNTEKILVYFIPFCMFMLYFFFIKAYWTRFLYAFLGSGLIAAAIFLSEFNWGRKYLNKVGLLCVLVSISELAKRKQIFIGLLISIILFFTIVKMQKFNFVNIRRLYNRFKYLTLLIFLISFIVFLSTLNVKYEREQYKRYSLFYEEREVGEGWRWIGENTTAGTRIAYAGRPETYPLLGNKFQNSVFYISINDKPAIPYNYPDGDYRKEKSYVAWLRNLKEQRVDFLFVYQSQYDLSFPLENQWAQEYPEKFNLVYSNPKIRIYSLNKE